MRVAAVGTTAEDFGAEAARLAVGHAGRRSARVMSALVERLEEHRRRGDRVVVATGCASPLAELVRGALGPDGVEVVASRLDRTRWGLPRAVPARGEGELRALASAGVPLRSTTPAPTAARTCPSCGPRASPTWSTPRHVTSGASDGPSATTST